jgi:DNA polymerase V
LSDNNGCAVVRSPEAKAPATRMGTPRFQLPPLVRRHGLIGLSSNYTLHGDMRVRVMQVLRCFTPDAEA